MTLTAQQIANEASLILRDELGRKGPRPELANPEHYIIDGAHFKHEDRMVHHFLVPFPPGALELSLYNFSDNYIDPAMIVIVDKIGQRAKFLDQDQELPTGVDASANSTISPRVRVCLDNILPKKGNTLPTHKIPQHYDIETDTLLRDVDVVPIFTITILTEPNS